MQINTLLHDVYTTTRLYPSPRSFVFIMKRSESSLAGDHRPKTDAMPVDPGSSFENPSDYLHIFAAEESIGLKLMSAVYDAKVSDVVSNL